MSCASLCCRTPIPSTPIHISALSLPPSQSISPLLCPLQPQKLGNWWPSSATMSGAIGSSPKLVSVKSFTGRSITGSNVRRRCQNNIAKKASKLNELPGNSSSQISLVGSSGLFPDSSAAVNSSHMCTSNSKADKSVKKN